MKYRRLTVSKWDGTPLTDQTIPDEWFTAKGAVSINTGPHSRLIITIGSPEEIGETDNGLSSATG